MKEVIMLTLVLVVYPSIFALIRRRAQRRKDNAEEKNKQ